MFGRSFRKFFNGKRTPIRNSKKVPRKTRPTLEQLERREMPAVYTPGNLIVLQAGDGTAYNAQAPLYLNEYTTTAGASIVQQAAIPNNQVVGGLTNQPITIDLAAAAGNGQLNRSADGAVLTFGGVDSGINNGGLTLPSFPTGQSDRVTAITGNNLNNISSVNYSSSTGSVTITTAAAHGFTSGQSVTITGITTGSSSTTANPFNGTFNISGVGSSSFTYTIATGQSTPNNPTVASPAIVGNIYNTTTHGQYYVGDDDRGAVAVSANGPIYAVGHPNQAGAAVSQGVLLFPTPGPALGTQVSFQANIRGGLIGFDNRLYYSTAGSAQAGLAGIYTEAKALPGLADANPSVDVPVVKALFSASKLGGMYLADVNGNGVLDNGDRIYFLDDGTVGGAGTGGLYMSVYDTTRFGGANAVPGQSPGWSPAIRLGEGIISAQPTPQTTAQLRGLAGTVLYSSNSTVQLYASEFDNVAGNNSYILSFTDNTPGIFSITSASDSVSGTTGTASITVSGTLPSSFVNGATVVINSVGTGTGNFATAGGYNGVWTIGNVGSNSFTFTRTESTALGTITNSGVTDLAVTPSIIQTLGDSSATITTEPPTVTKAAQGLRGVAFAPVAPTTVNLTFTPANPVNPGTQITLTATLTNAQLTAAQLQSAGSKVTFIDLNTNTVLGSSTISSAGTASLTVNPALVGNHNIQAYFAGGGTLALPSATSNTAQVLEAGPTITSTALAASFSAVAVGVPVTFTATVAGSLAVAPTGTVSFYNGSVTTANLLGTTTLNASGVTTFSTAFASPGTQTIIAVYNGDNVYASSQISTNLTVTANATATLTTSANNVALNATPTYTVTVNGNSTLGTPTGTVQFFLQDTFTGVTKPLGGIGISAATENASGSVTITTATAHGFTTGQQVAISGVAVGGYNGTFTVTNIDSTHFSYTDTNLGLGNSSGGFATPFTALNASGSATITSSALSDPGSYLLTASYFPASGSPYAPFALNTTTSASGTALIETVQQAFTPGNLIAVQRGDGSVNLGSSGYLTFITEYTPAGALVQKIALPNQDAASVGITSITETAGGNPTVTVTTSGANPFTAGQVVTIQGASVAGYNGDFTVLGSTSTTFTYVNTNTGATGLGAATGGTASGGSSHALLLSGQSGAEGLLNRSANGYFLTLAGYDVPVGRQFVTSTFPYQFPRTLARLDLGANVNTTTAVLVGQNSGSSVPFNPLDVVSNDGTQFWLASSLPTGDTTDSGILYVSALGSSSFTQVGPSNVGPSAIAIAGGQLYVTNTGGDVQAVGTGLPTAKTTLAGLPGLGAAYASFFGTSASPEQVLLLNTNDGTSNNPNLAYIADQANGLLKFELVNGTWQFGNGNPTTPAGEKLLGAGGVTGVVGFINNPGQSTASVQLYVTGNNNQGANPNQIASLLDHNGAPGNASLGFVGTDNFSRLVFVGQTGSGSSASFNGNENFAGLAFAPGYTTTTSLSSSETTGNYSDTITFTATVSETGNSSINPTGVVTFFDNGIAIGTGTLSASVGGSASATFTTTNLGSGTHAITAFYNGDVKDGTSTSSPVAVTLAFVSGDLVVTRVGTGTGSLTSSTATTFLDQFTTGGTANGSTAMPTATLSATISTISEGSGSASTTATATTSATHGFAAGETVTITGASVAGYNKSFTITAVGSTTFTFTATAGLGSSTGGTAVVTRTLAETGNATSEGYLTGSTDGHSLSLVGYNVAPGGSTSGVNRDIAVVGASGSTDYTTQLPSSTGNVRVAISADGLGFWVATSTGIRYVPFGNNGAASTQVTAEVSSPTAVGIGTLNTTGTGSGTPGQLFASAGAGAQSNGVPALDSPFQVGSGLPTVGGQAVTVSPSFPTAQDTFRQFPSTNQFAISPDGNTIFIADSRTDSLGGILEYFQTTANTWALLGSLQLDSFSISSATESGTTVTITAAGHNFTAGQSVTITGVTVGGYNGSFTVTAAGTDTFTFTNPTSGLAASSGGKATSNDGGLRALVADFSGSSPVLYATTTNPSANRIVKITGATLNGSTPSLAYTTLATAPANEAYRGVALAPKAAGTGSSTTTLALGSSTVTYGAGTTLTATVNVASGTPTGWVSFRNGSTEFGAAQLVSGSASFNLIGNLGASSATYSNITAVYTGDSSFAGSTSSAASLTINKAVVNSSNLTVVSNGTALSSGASVATGAPIVLTDTITVPAGTVPTGTVTFFNGSTSIGLGTLSQVIQNVSGSPSITFTATFNATALATLGTESLSATYSGDTNFNSNGSNTFTLNVVNSTSTTVTTNNANADGTTGTDSVTFTAAVTSGAAGTITGSVQFYDDLLPIGSPVTLSSASATVTVAAGLVQSGTNLVPGLHSITAIYTPDSSSSATFATSSGVYEQTVKAQAFNSADYFVYRIGDGTTKLTAQSPSPIAGNGAIGSTIYIDEYNTSGTIVQSLILPTADGTGSQNTIKAVVGNGQQSSTEQLSVAGDGQSLWLVGYDTNPLNAATAPAIPTAGSVTRSVARISATGTIQTEALSNTITGTSNFNGVFSPDGNKFYVSNGNTIYYFSSFGSSSTTVAPTATIGTTGGPTAVALDNAGGNLGVVGVSYTGATLVGQFAGLPTGSATIQTLPGLPSTDNFQQFPVDAYFTHLSSSDTTTTAPAGINTFYLTDNGPSFANGRITKWALSNSGTWSLVDTITAGTGNTAISFYYIAGTTDSTTGNVTLGVTYGNGGNSNTGPGQEYTFLDSNGWNKPIGSGGTHSDSFSSSFGVGSTSNQTFRGIAFIKAQPPSITSPASATFAQQVNCSFTVTTIGSATVTLSESGSLPGGVTFNAATGVLSGTPTVSGSFPISFTASNGAGSTTQTFNLTVTAGTAPTITSASTANFLLGSGSTSFTVTATATPAATFSATGLPAGLSINTTTGVISGTPTGTAGSTTATITATNGINPNATQNLVININQAPAITSANSATFTQNSAGTFTVTASGFPAATFSETGALPLGVNFNPSTGVLSGTPTTFGTFPIVITASNGINPAATQNFTLTVNGVAGGFGLLGTGSGSTTFAGANGMTFTPNGVVLRFTGPIDQTTVHLYDGPGGTAGPANVTLSNATTTVRGSLIIDPSQPNTATFLASGGSLASGSYTVTVGTSVKGTGGITGPGFTSSGVTVTAPSTPVVSVPSFSRGAGQTVNIPADTGSGIPVTLSNASNVTLATFGIVYDKTLLTIASSGAVTPSSAATTVGLTSVSYSITDMDSHHALLAIRISGGTGLTAGSSGVALVNIAATVPNSAPYFSKAVLDVQDVQINGVTGTGASVSGVDEAAYLGDVKGDKSITPLSATLINLVSSGSGTGFTAFKDLDPNIIGDPSGTGNPVAPLDASLINLKSSGGTVAKIPDPGLGSSSITTAADPILFFQASQAGQGQAVTIHLMLNVTESAGINLAALAEAIAFDPNIFTVSNVVGGASESANILSISESGTTVTVITDNPLPASANGGTVTIAGVPVGGYNGTVTITGVSGNSFTYTAGSSGLASSKGGTVTVAGLGTVGTYSTTAGTVDNTNGRIRISQSYSGSPIPGTQVPHLAAGSLIDVVDFTATINGSASIGTATALNLLASYTSNGTTTTTSVSDLNGNLTLNPAPTDASNDSGVDSTLTVISQYGTLYVGNVNASAGSTITVPIFFQNGTVPVPLAALAEAISFDPTVLQVTNVVGGSGSGGLSGVGTYSTTAGTQDNTNGLIRISQSYSGSPIPGSQVPVVNPGQLVEVADITFTVNSAASGSTIVNLRANATSNGTTTTTSVSNLDGNIVLKDVNGNPPTNAATDLVDGVVSIVIVPNQPPFDKVPLASVVPTVLFNPAAVAGLQTASPNAVTFSATGGVGGANDAITVSDPDAGVGTITTELKLTSGGVSSAPVGKLTVNPALPTAAATISTAAESSTTVTVTTSAAHGFAVGEVVTISGVSVSGYNGTFTITSVPDATHFTYIDSVTGLGSATAGSASFALSISGNNSSDVILNGALANINLALNGLKYTPGANYFGTTTLSVSTNDNGNTGFGGAQTDTRTTSITVVGLYISEVFNGPNPVSTDPASPATQAPFQYIEIFSTIPNYTIPNNVYFIGINGNDDTNINSFAGQISDVFNLGGFKTGANGYLAFLEAGNTYTKITAGNVYTNTGGTTPTGFGTGSTSVFNGVSGVHTGIANGGTVNDNYGFPTDIQQGSITYLLIQTTSSTPAAPTVTDIIDTGANSSSATPNGIPGGTEYNSWNILDGVGILRNTNGSFGPDTSYAPITFKASGNTTGTTLSGSNSVSTTFTPTYVGRIAQNTGSSSADWLASFPTGSDAITSGTSTIGFKLNSTNSTKFGGQAMNSIGGPNFWAPSMTVQINDGNAQHSQVGFLVLTFNEAVTIGSTDLTTVFKIKDSENVTAASWSSGTASLTLQYPLTLTTGQTVTVSGMTPAGYNGTFTVTGVSGNTFTYSLPSDPGSGPVGFGTVTGNNLSLSITSDGTVGSSSITNVGSVTIKFASGSPDTFNFASSKTVAGQTLSVGLNDGNYFLNTDGTKISNNGVFLDYNHNGNPGSGGTQVDEFWRLFGDSRGSRAVDGTSYGDFKAVDNSTLGAKGSKYVWYFDSNEDGNIDVANTTDKTAFNARLFKNIKA